MAMNRMNISPPIELVECVSHAFDDAFRFNSVFNTEATWQYRKYYCLDLYRNFTISLHLKIVYDY